MAHREKEIPESPLVFEVPWIRSSGSKRLLPGPPRLADPEKWSSSESARKRRLIEILQEMTEDLEEDPGAERLLDATREGEDEDAGEETVFPVRQLGRSPTR